MVGRGTYVVNILMTFTGVGALYAEDIKFGWVWHVLHKLVIRADFAQDGEAVGTCKMRIRISAKPS